MDIHIEQLCFTYPHQTFRIDVPQLEIASGEQVAFIGPSGSGKTTLLRLLAGIYLPQEGSLRLDGVALAQMSDAQRRALRIQRIGFVFQDFRLIDYLNVRENIRFPYRLNRALAWSDAAAERLRLLMEATGIADKSDRPIEKLSHGEQQRVAICRALVAQPRLVLADEPTGNLDPASKRRVLAMLCEQARQQEATLIVVTHDEQVLDRFDRVIDFRSFQSSAA